MIGLRAVSGPPCSANIRRIRMAVTSAAPWRPNQRVRASPAATRRARTISNARSPNLAQSDLLASHTGRSTASLLVAVWPLAAPAASTRTTAAGASSRVH